MSKESRPDLLAEAIDRAIKIHIETALQECIFKAQGDLEKAVRDKVAHIALSVMGSYSIERHGHDIVIRVRNEMGRS